MYGFELVDSISYHAHQLTDLNTKADELQHVSFEYARTANKDLVRKLRNKADTRAAAVVETLKTSANIFTSGEGEGARGSPRKGRRKRKGRGGVGGTGGGSGSGGNSASNSGRDDLRGGSSYKVDIDPGANDGSSSASASASASAAAGVSGRAKAAPFWETFLFGAQAPEFDLAAQAQLRRIATPEKEHLLVSPEGGEGGRGRGGQGRKRSISGGGRGAGQKDGGATYNPLLLPQPQSLSLSLSQAQTQAQAQSLQTPLSPRRASLADAEVTVKVREGVEEERGRVCCACVL